MYTEEDLNEAVGKGIFSDDSVNQFRLHIAAQKNTTIADEENFRLISGFNDVFVVIASGLLLVAKKKSPPQAPKDFKLPQ